MTRGSNFYLNLAADRLRMPIGTDLVLHEQPDPQAIRHDGRRLGCVVIEAAQRYRTPLALPLMDLTIEKGQIITALGNTTGDIDAAHLDTPPNDSAIQRVRDSFFQSPTPRLRANLLALETVASRKDLVPVGMCIGPFSLLTKLLADPITAVYLAGSGASETDEPDVTLACRVLELAATAVLASVERQIHAGAAAIMVCEPAANRLFLSPHQMTTAGSGDVFDTFVMCHLQALKRLLDVHDVDLILHDCGEMEDEMVRRLGSLCPTVLSLGSSRRLWEDACLVPHDVVLYGNLPSRRFYSDELCGINTVQQLATELDQRMLAADHPFILGSECDVLHVEGCGHTIRCKVDAMMQPLPTDGSLRR